MANNYLQFSEVIPNLTAEEERWLTEQLEPIVVVNGVEYPYPEGSHTVTTADGKKVSIDEAEFSGCRAYRDLPDFDNGQADTPGFERSFGDDTSAPDGWGRHLWLYSEESGELDLVAHFLQKFLRKFRPQQCWSLTYSETCSKPRVGEFAGGAVFITADEIRWENAYEFVRTCSDKFRSQHVVPRLVQRARELGIQPEDLNELVHSVASVPASDVNHGGLEGQIALLIEQVGAHETERAIERVAGRRKA